MTVSALVSGARLDAAGRYIHWGVIQISLTNLLVIVGMVILFVLALVVPFPGAHSSDPARKESHDEL